MASIVDLYLVYRILRKLTQPFTDWEAYKLGVIDDKGVILKGPSDRNTMAERDSFSKFDLMILKMKNLLAKVPGGRSTFATYTAALLLIKEEHTLTDDNLQERFELYLKQNINPLTEETIANNIGDGNIEHQEKNLGTKKKKLLRRKKFGVNEVFVVDSDTYMNSRFGKKKYVRFEMYVGNDEVGEEIRQFGREFPNKPIILEDENTGARLCLRYGKSGMFTESFDLVEVYMTETVSKSDLDGVETYADKLFKAVDIDINFTRHFLDRANDSRNGKEINTAELIRLFRLAYKKYGKKIAALGTDAEAVLNDMKTDINMPFVLKWDNKSQELDLVAKTVMRKKNFKTPDAKLSV